MSDIIALALAIGTIIAVTLWPLWIIIILILIYKRLKKRNSAL